MVLRLIQKHARSIPGSKTVTFQKYKTSRIDGLKILKYVWSKETVDYGNLYSVDIATMLP